MSSADDLGGRRARMPNSWLPVETRAASDPAAAAADRAAAAADRAAAAEDRRLAEADRRRAAQYLADAYLDDVTGALTRRCGRQQLNAEVDRAHRTSAPLAVIFIDIDGLKQINDTYGHARGDQLLAATGMALRSSLRSYDVIVRYGGDEFVCVLPGATAEDASASIDRILSALAGLMPGATLSAGHTQLLTDDTLDDAIRRADADLYRRRAGRLDGQDRTSRRDVFDVSRRRSWQPVEPTLACGECNARIPLSDFVLQDVMLMVRCADCSVCGETTLIHLAQGKRKERNADDQ